jgi:outer membrane protein OmpA-like peptidoglycan-associated protein
LGGFIVFFTCAKYHLWILYASDLYDRWQPNKIILGTGLNQERVEEERGRDIDQLLITLAKNVESDKCVGAKVDRERRIIDFGSQVLFPHSKHQLDPQQEKHLRECVPEILAIASNELGKKWIKRIVVEGYTSTRGTYLYNLNLSLQRSQRVLCVLLAPEGLKPELRSQVRNLFLVGGYSSNSAKASDELSRRVELRLEFWAAKEARETISQNVAGIDLDNDCRLDNPSQVERTPPRPAPKPSPRRTSPFGTGFPNLFGNQ